MNLLEVFNDMPEYVLIKMRDDFPEYKKGQDMDIVCRDVDKVIFYLKEYFYDKYIIDISSSSLDHFHFDCLEKSGKLELRFDLYGHLISEKFTGELLEHKETMRFNGGHVCVPMPAYEGVIKCWEFLLNGKEKYGEYIIFKNTLVEYTK